jgi:hypothetical protein
MVGEMTCFPGNREPAEETPDGLNVWQGAAEIVDGSKAQLFSFWPPTRLALSMTTKKPCVQCQVLLGFFRRTE